MLHDIIEEVDEGEPLLVEEIEMKIGESLEDLERRVHQVEWKAIVAGVNIALKRLEAKLNG